MSCISGLTIAGRVSDARMGGQGNGWRPDGRAPAPHALNRADGGERVAARDESGAEPAAEGVFGRAVALPERRCMLIQ